MNKTAIKNFAIWARNKLIADISYRAGLMGITADGIQKALPQSTGTTEFYDIGTVEPYSISGDAVKQRKHLVELIQRKENETNYKTAYKYVLEEVAYTWFNRLIAVRFMEVNDYLPSHIRVLSSDSGKMEPDLITNPFSAGLSFTSDEEQAIYQLKQENKLDEVFRILFIKQCNALNENLPALFEKTSDYTELLLNLSVIDQDGLVYHLVHDIPEEDFDVERGGQVEIIGWLYQYYNTELNDLVYDGSYAKEKVSKELLPAATTIYTPDWVVRYMVENSLGHLWIEGHPNDSLKAGWKYYLEEAEQESEVQAKLAEIRTEYAKLNPEDIKVIDPCMGSGHILVYAFDILMQIYESAGYGQRDAARSILENNLYGLDIDDRAFQIAYFAVMMKARQYNRRILNGEYKPNIYSIQESNGINRSQLKYFGAGLNKFEKNNALSQMIGLLDTFRDAKEYGSILTVDQYDWELLDRFVSNIEVIGQLSMYTVGLDDTAEELKQQVAQGKVLAQKYHVATTNPPYLGSSRFNNKLDLYVKKHYLKEKSDLSMIMYRAALEHFSAANGFVAFITTSSWMYLSSFETIRKKVIKDTTISSLVEFGTELFEGKVGHNPIVSWVVRNTASNQSFPAIRLVEYCYSRKDEKEWQFFENYNRYVAHQHEFEFMPGSPIAYWLSAKVFELYEEGETMESVAHPKVGMQTSNNDKYLRLWFEIDYSEFQGSSKGLKWIKYLKGGAYRKWYGNLDWLLFYNYDPAFILKQKNARVLDLSFLEKKKCTWTDLTSGSNSFRIAPDDTFYDISGHCFFPKESDQLWLLAYANSVVFSELKKVFNSTFHCQVGDVAKIVVPQLDDTEKCEIERMAQGCIDCAREDWNSFETSWDFCQHPLTKYKVKTIEEAYLLWSTECQTRQETIITYEKKINEIFIKSLNLMDDFDADVNERDVSYIRTADKSRETRSLLSYCVGCQFGRYSLDMKGVICSSPLFEEHSYLSFIPDMDNIIPITDEEYLEDDVVARLCTWLKIVYGEETLEQNLDFIASALGGKESSSRDIIRNYFLNDFFKDHCASYSVGVSGRRPIYWLFYSGKQNGFKALIYLHRYNADTIGNLRIDYLHRMQRIYESEISRMQDMIDHSTSGREVALATKRREKLTKQLKECREYDEKLAHLALSRIELDLDDGVKKNYRKIQTANDGKFYEVLADSKNIMSKE